jgi:hypothetical protein
MPILKKMFRYGKTAPFVIFFFFISFCFLLASLNHQTEPGEIFDRIEKGIQQGDIDTFSAYLGPQIAITMGGDRSGCYSPNQAYSILKNFFGMRKTLGFEFSTKNESERRATATGGGRFLRRGTKEYLQIYVMLNRVDGQWIISQIHFY